MVGAKRPDENLAMKIRVSNDETSLKTNTLTKVFMFRAKMERDEKTEMKN
jgi:hypothetical protein